MLQDLGLPGMPDAKTHILDSRIIFFFPDILLLWPKSGLSRGGVHTFYDGTILIITVLGSWLLRGLFQGGLAVHQA